MKKIGQAPNSHVATDKRNKEKFWRGFGLEGCPSFKDISVLEIGCGEGDRAIEIASHGAKRVVGVDPLEILIIKAKEKAAKLSAQDSNLSMTFIKGKISDLRDEKFDIIISEDALEHVIDVPSLLNEIHYLLSPGGKVMLGFGPIYDGPFGDHGWLRNELPGAKFFPWPWGHLYLRRMAFRRLSRRYNRTIQATRDWPFLDLNQLSIGDYLEVFNSSPMSVSYLKINSMHSTLGHFIALLQKIPLFGRYFVINIFAILEKPKPDNK